MSGSGFSWSRDRFATPHVLCHFASAKTFCADRKPFRFAVNQSTHLLKVGIPAPFGGIIGVRDVISESRFLTAYFTHFGHSVQLLSVKPRNLSNLSEKASDF